MGAAAAGESVEEAWFKVSRRARVARCQATLPIPHLCPRTHTRNNTRSRTRRVCQHDACAQGMWLSNGDFLRYFESALTAVVPRGAPLLVNAMSNNSGMRWSLKETRSALNVEAQDDSRR